MSLWGEIIMIMIFELSFYFSAALYIELWKRRQAVLIWRCLHIIVIITYFFFNLIFDVYHWWLSLIIIKVGSPDWWSGRTNAPRIWGLKFFHWIEIESNFLQATVKTTRINPVSRRAEPFVPGWSRFGRHVVTGFYPWCWASESESILCESESSRNLSLLGLDLKCKHATSIASANITSLEIIALAWLLSQELSSASWWWWWSALCLPSSSSELFSCPPCKSESLKGTWSIEKI